MAATVQMKGESEPCLLEIIGSITLIDFAGHFIERSGRATAAWRSQRRRRHEDCPDTGSKVGATANLTVLSSSFCLFCTIDPGNVSFGCSIETISSSNVAQNFL